MESDWDVIVVGGGGSGLAAAVSAAENGLKVVVLEKQPQLGGTTAIAVGSFTAAETRLQRDQGVEDRLAWHQEDAGGFAPPEIEARNNKPLRDFFLAHAAETLDWVAKQGVAFYGPNPEPPNRAPRMHNATPNAQAYIAAFESRLRKLAGTIACNVRVDELILEDGRVLGVVVERDSNRTRLLAHRGVVLATGDYANSSEMLAQHKGAGFGCIEGINPHSLGEGHALAVAAGAELVNMDVAYGPEIRFEAPSQWGILSWLPTRGIAAQSLGRLAEWAPKFLLNAFIKRLLVTWQHPENSLFEDGAILINQAGHRFCDELTWPARELAIAAQPEKRCYLLLDESLVQAYSQWPKFVSTAPQIAYAYIDDYLRLRPDMTSKASSLEHLAEAKAIPSDELRKTVADYNQAVKDDAPDPFERARRKPLKGKSWVLMGPAKAYFTTTEGGAAISQSCQVLDHSRQPIPGLYAVGQVGLGGQILFGHGLHIAWALTSGRIVGRTLAEQR